MPKIIENLESRLLDEAKKQLFDSGYGALTIRSVAKDCGVGVGTVYNYFASKDDMIAMIMLRDMDLTLTVIQETVNHSDSVRTMLQCTYDQLVKFAREHSGMFRDKVEAAAFLGSFHVYQEDLRKQIAQILRNHCESDFSAEFVAEAMLTWTMAKKSFDEIYGMIEKLFDVPHT